MHYWSASELNWERTAKVSSGAIPETDGAHKSQNPPLVLIDTDVLVQFLLVNEITPLRELKRRYKVQPAIVEAVEFELRSPGKSLRKYSSLIQPRLQKALGNGTILLLDGRSLPAVVGVGAHAVETQIALLGTRYHNYVDYGEAYSHAAAAVLAAPLFSHDSSAIRALRRAGEKCADILRAFDLYTLAYHITVLNIQSCDQARQMLASSREWLPEAFLKRSFANGLPVFFPRLLDRDLPAIGSSMPIEIGDAVQFLLAGSG